MQTQKKYNKLKSILKEMGKVVVAYSGGVDSAFLLKVAHDVLGENTFGVLAVSPSYPSREFKQAMDLAGQIGVRVEIIHTKELNDARFVNNPVDRCYFCKSELFEKIAELAGSGNYPNMVDGTNFDDRHDHRPGMKALREKKVGSPLLEAELTKNEIRVLSKKLDLPTWEKDELACLSSRFPYGEPIDKEKLNMVDQVENFLSDLGFRNIRARHFGKTVKIEVRPDQVQRLFEENLRERIVKKIKDTGYVYVTIDMEGYRRGSMNEGPLSKSNPEGLRPV